MKQQLIFILNELEEMPKSSRVKELIEKTEGLLSTMKTMSKEELKGNIEKLNKEVEEIWDDLNYERDVTRNLSVEEIEKR